MNLGLWLDLNKSENVRLLGQRRGMAWAFFMYLLKLDTNPEQKIVIIGCIVVYCTAHVWLCISKNLGT